MTSDDPCSFSALTIEALLGRTREHSMYASYMESSTYSFSPKEGHSTKSDNQHVRLEPAERRASLAGDGMARTSLH